MQFRFPTQFCLTTLSRGIRNETGFCSNHGHRPGKLVRTVGTRIFFSIYAISKHVLRKKPGLFAANPKPLIEREPSPHTFRCRPRRARVRCTAVPSRAHPRVSFRSSFTKNLEILAKGGRFTFPHGQGRIAVVPFGLTPRRTPGAKRPISQLPQSVAAGAKPIAVEIEFVNRYNAFSYPQPGLVATPSDIPPGD